MSDEDLRDLFRPLTDDLPLGNGRYMLIDFVASIYENDPIGGLVYWEIPNEV